MVKRSLGRKIVGNTVYLFGAELIVRILTFITVGYQARILGVDGFGKLEFSFVVVSYFAIITALGLNAFGNIGIAKDKRKSSDYLGNILAIQLSFSVFTIPLLIGFSYLSSQNPIVRWLLIAQSLYILADIWNVEWVFLGLKRMKIVGLFRVLMRLVYLLLVVLFVNNLTQLIIIPLLFAIAYFIADGYLWFHVWRIEKISFRLIFAPLVWKTFLRQSMPMMGAFLLTRAYNNIDVVLLGIIKHDETVGLYSGAYKIINLFMSFRILLSTVLLPYFAELYERSRDKLSTLVNLVEKLSVGFLIPIVIGLIFLAEPVIKLIYGSGFIEAVFPFQLLMISVIFALSNLVFPSLLYVINRQDKYFQIYLITNLSCVVLYFITIPSFGMYGAAVVTILGSIVHLFWFYFEVQKVVRLHLFTLFPKVMIASVLMGVFLFYFRDLSLIIRVIGGASIYLLTLFCLKYLSVNDLAYFKKVFNEIMHKGKGEVDLV